MEWIIAGTLVLAVLAIVFHVVHEYFWSVVFFLGAGILGSVVLVMASQRGILGP